MQRDTQPVDLVVCLGLFREGDDMSDEHNNDTTTQDAEPAPQATPAGSGPDAEACRWAMFTHLSALAGFIIPFGNIIGPLVMWQAKKDDPFVDSQGKEALNFQITVTIAAFVCFLLTFVLIGLLLLPVLGIVALVFIIIAAIRANDGEDYQYPLTIRLVT